MLAPRYLIVLAATFFATAAPASAAPWLESYDNAIATARRTGKTVLANFTGSDWCGWCIRLDKEVFSTPRFQQWADQNVVLLKLDYPRRRAQSPALKHRNEQLARKFRVGGFPTILFIDANGAVVGRSGYRKGGPGPWIGHAGKFVAKVKPETSQMRSVFEGGPAPGGAARVVSGRWTESFGAARLAASRHDQPMLLKFTGSDWCRFTKRMEQEVFARPQFTGYARDRLILVQVDFPRKAKQKVETGIQNLKLKRRLGVRGYPTYVLMDPRGRIITKWSGFQKGGPGRFIARIEQALHTASNRTAEVSPSG